MDQAELQRRLGAALLRRRLEARLGQERLADLAGLHRTHVSALERNQGGLPTLGVLYKLAKALGTTMSALLAEVESEGPPPSEPPEIPRGRPPRQGKANAEEEGTPD